MVVKFKKVENRYQERGLNLEFKWNIKLFHFRIKVFYIKIMPRCNKKLQIA